MFTSRNNLPTLLLGAAVLAGQLCGHSPEHRHPAGVRTAIELVTKRQKVATTALERANDWISHRGPATRA